MTLDGTKLKANASLSANRRYSSIEKEVKRILDEAAANDAEEDRLYGPDNRGDEIPDELKDRQKRLARLQEAKKRLEQEAAEAAAKQEENIRQRKALREKRSPRGRIPKDISLRDRMEEIRT